MKRKTNRKIFDHSGSSFDRFLQEEGIREEIESIAAKRVSLAVPTPLRGSALRHARGVLNLTQAEAGLALGGIRQETISRWEQGTLLKLRRASAQPIRELVELATLLVDMYPNPQRRREFLHRPQRGLGDQHPANVLLKERPPNGIHKVWLLLIEVAHGIPS
jgi:uncharacterized protein (DUF2384 family)